MSKKPRTPLRRPDPIDRTPPDSYAPCLPSQNGCVYATPDLSVQAVVVHRPHMDAFSVTLEMGVFKKFAHAQAAADTLFSLAVDGTGAPRQFTTRELRALAEVMRALNLQIDPVRLAQAVSALVVEGENTPLHVLDGLPDTLEEG